MDRDYLTLQDAAILLGKSMQTVRRMIKKGDLKAQKIRTSQGFHYVVKRDDLGVQVFYDSPIQNANIADEEAEKESLTNQTQILTSQTGLGVHKEANFQGIDKLGDEWSEEKIVENFHNLQTKGNGGGGVNGGSMEEVRAAEGGVDGGVGGGVERVKGGLAGGGEDGSREEFLRIIDLQHVELMFLMRILEKLQSELDRERKIPKSFFAYLIDWLF